MDSAHLPNGNDPRVINRLSGIGYRRFFFVVVVIDVIDCYAACQERVSSGQRPQATGILVFFVLRGHAFHPLVIRRCERLHSAGMVRYGSVLSIAEARTLSSLTRVQINAILARGVPLTTLFNPGDLTRTGLMGFGSNPHSEQSRLFMYSLLFWPS